MISWFQSLLSHWVNLCRYAAMLAGCDKLADAVQVTMVGGRLTSCECS
jgi:hypothetical protein